MDPGGKTPIDKEAAVIFGQPFTFLIAFLFFLFFVIFCYFYFLFLFLSMLYVNNLKNNYN